MCKVLNSSICGLAVYDSSEELPSRAHMESELNSTQNRELSEHMFNILHVLFFLITF